MRRGDFVGDGENVAFVLSAVYVNALQYGVIMLDWRALKSASAVTRNLDACEICRAEDLVRAIMRGLPVLLRSATPRPFTTLLMCSLGARDLSEKSGATGVHGSHMGGRSVGQKKIRHHVNPLKDVHMRPLDLPPRWPEHHFADPLLPLHVDIGCARGVFCLDLATAAPELNVCGLEIRDLLAETASQDAKRLGLGNAAFFAANANVNLDALLSGAAETGRLQSVSIQYACKHTATASIFYSLALTRAMRSFAAQVPRPVVQEAPRQASRRAARLNTDDRVPSAAGRLAVDAE